jgi:hypothetical protein
VAYTPVVQGPAGTPVAHTRGGSGGALSTLPDWWAIIDAMGGTSTPSSGSGVPDINGQVGGGLLPVAFGLVRVPGTMLYVQGLGDMTSGQGVIAWSEGEIGSIDTLYGGFAARSDAVVTVVVNQHVGEPGGETNPGNIFGSAKPGFASAAYTHWTIATASGYRWWNYIPGGSNDGGWGASSGVMAVVPWWADIHALKVYDPRLDSTNGGTGTQRYNDPTTWAWSQNPILQSCYLLVKYGNLHPGVDIDWPNIAAMAQASDDAGFTCNIVFSTKTLLRDALTAVLQTCNGQPISVNGKAGFFLDIPNPAAAVASFSEEDGDIFGLKYEWLSARDRYTQYAVSFKNSAADYKDDQTPIFGDPGTFSSEATKTVSSVNTTTETLTLTSSPGWSVNDTVRFSQNAGVAIPGLADGATYYVKTISGADVTLAPSAGGVVINLTGTPVITTQYLQRVGLLYPPTVVVKLQTVNAPGINTLAAAIILRDYLYNAQAITFRISGTMNGRGILLQQGQKIHLTTLKGIDADFLLIQIPGDAQGFFAFVAKPYSAGTYGSTPITQTPPIVPTPPPNPATAGSDVSVTSTAGERKSVTSSSTVTTVYNIWQVVTYQLPTTGTPLKELRVRGFRGTGALTKTWADMVASEVVIPLVGNEPPPDATHSALSVPSVVKTIETLTFDSFGRLSNTTDVTGPTRIIIKTATSVDALSTGVTIDVAAATTSVDVTLAPADTGRSRIIEQPAGAIDGANRIFTASKTPSTSRIMCFVDKAFLVGGVDYGRVGPVVTLKYTVEPPRQTVIFDYDYGNIDDGHGTPETLPLGTASTWTAEAIASFDWADVAFSPPLQVFAALHRATTGGTTAIYTSTDGQAWTPQTTPGTANWKSISWVNDRFLVSSETSSPQTIYSTDGVTWLGGTGRAATARYAYGAGLYVGVYWGASSDISTSPDLTTWTDYPIGSSQTMAGLCYSPPLGLFVAVGSAGAIYTSPNGVTWTPQSGGTGRNWASVIWVTELGLFVAVASGDGGSQNTNCATSPDGVNWTTRATPNTHAHTWQAVAWSVPRQLLVAVSGSTYGEALSVMTSYNGIAWTEQVTPFVSGPYYGHWRDVACSDGATVDVVVAVGGASGTSPTAMFSLA